MNTIGEKIKELRKKNSLTQETLAEKLGVSSQAVSKWETGAASPDLAMLVPLAKIYQISTDQLLEYKDRRTELENFWQLAVRDGYGKTLEVSEEALKEYPHDVTFLYRRACDEFFYADKVITDAALKQEYFERSVRHFKEIIVDYPDFDSANGMLIPVLVKLGRHEEALGYAIKSKEPDHLLKLCLTGDALQKHQQGLILKALEKLLVELTQYNPPHWLHTAVKITDIIVSDGLLDPVDDFLNKPGIFSSIYNFKDTAY
jgi:transcriptional regulator with XRE-family HTH domain